MPAGWTVDIDADHVVTVSAPEGAHEPADITFTAVFHWPREAPLLPRLTAELLGVALVRGQARRPRTALSRTLTAHLRLIPWPTSGVRATAQDNGEVVGFL